MFLSQQILDGAEDTLLRCATFMYQIVLVLGCT